MQRNRGVTAGVDIAKLCEWEEFSKYVTFLTNNFVHCNVQCISELAYKLENSILYWSD